MKRRTFIVAATATGCGILLPLSQSPVPTPNPFTGVIGVVTISTKTSPYLTRHQRALLAISPCFGKGRRIPHSKSLAGICVWLRKPLRNHREGRIITTWCESCIPIICHTPRIWAVIPMMCNHLNKCAAARGFRDVSKRALYLFPEIHELAEAIAIPEA